MDCDVNSGSQTKSQSLRDLSLSFSFCEQSVYSVESLHPTVTVVTVTAMTFKCNSCLGSQGACLSLHSTPSQMTAQLIMLPTCHGLLAPYFPLARCSLASRRNPTLTKHPTFVSLSSEITLLLVPVLVPFRKQTHSNFNKGKLTLKNYYQIRD